MVAATPARAAANEIDCPWLPRVAVTSPGTFGCERVSRSRYTMPPRTLKAPVGVWFSCLTQTVQPAKRRSFGQAYCGVGGTTRCTSSAALSNSFMLREMMDPDIVTSCAGRLYRGGHA